MNSPLNVVLSAMAAGAAADFMDSAGEQEKVVYEQLRALLLEKFSGNPKAEMVLEEYCKQPEIWVRPMEAMLGEARVDEDRAVLRSAENFLELIRVEPVEKKSDILFTDEDGNIIGDQSRVEQYFNPVKSRKRT